MRSTLYPTSSAVSPLSPSPAAWSTPLTPLVQATIVYASYGSAVSHTTTSALLPSERSSSTKPCPSRTTRPLRDARTHPAPRSTISAAARSPSPPSPPLIAYRPDRVRAAPTGAAVPQCDRRRAEKGNSVRHACSASASADANGRPVTSAAISTFHCVSMFCTLTPACSRRRTRDRPHTPPFIARLFCKQMLAGLAVGACVPHVKKSTRGCRG